MDLSFCCNFNDNTANELITLKHLEELNLTQTDITTNFMSIIGESLTQLINLNLSRLVLLSLIILNL